MMALDDVSISNNKWTSVGRVTSDFGDFETSGLGAARHAQQLLFGLEA